MLSSRVELTLLRLAAVSVVDRAWHEQAVLAERTVANEGVVDRTVLVLLGERNHPSDFSVGVAASLILARLGLWQ